MYFIMTPFIGAFVGIPNHVECNVCRNLPFTFLTLTLTSTKTSTLS